jgi:hypothetical protein
MQCVQRPDRDSIEFVGRRAFDEDFDTPLSDGEESNTEARESNDHELLRPVLCDDFEMDLLVPDAHHHPRPQLRSGRMDRSARDPGDRAWGTA